MRESFIAKTILAKDLVIDKFATDSVMKKLVVKAFGRKPFNNMIEKSALCFNGSEQTRYEVQRSSVFF